MSRKEFVFDERQHQPSNGWQNNNSGGYHQNYHQDKPKHMKKNKPHNEVLLKDGEYTLNPSLTKGKYEYDSGWKMDNFETLKEVEPVYLEGQAPTIKNEKLI